MGMAMELFAVRDATLQRLLEDPPLVWRLISPDEPEMYEEARKEARGGSMGFLSRLFGGSSKSTPLDGVGSLELTDGEGHVADLDKAWHGLHFLLTGSAEAGNPPLDFLAVGGEEIGDVDVGYGPARALRPMRVAEIAAMLESLSDAALRARFDGAAMTELNIYPDIWDRDPKEDDTLSYLLANLASLRAGVSESARRQHGLVLVLR